MNLRASTAPQDRWRRSHLGGLLLLLRHRRPVRGQSLLVALMALAVAALLAAAPSVFTAMTAQELDQTIDQAPPSARYLIAHPSGQIVSGPAVDAAASGLSDDIEPFAGSFRDQLLDARSQLPQPLRSLVGPPQFSLVNEAVPVSADARLHTTPPTGSVSMIYRLDSNLDRYTHLTSGHWPASTNANVMQAAVSEHTAAKLGWKIGQQIPMFPYDGAPQVQLVGIFAPDDAADDYWALHPTVIDPNLFDDGNRPASYTASAYLSANGISTMQYQVSVLYPLNLAKLSGSEATVVLGQVRGAVATPFAIPAGLPAAAQAGTVQSIRLDSDALPLLQGSLDRVRAAQSVLTIAAAGPLAAAIAVLVLAVRTLLRRRQSLVGLLATRGASPRRLRLLLAADGLTVGLPPALIAAAAVWWIFGADTSPAGLVLAAMAGLVPAGMLATIRVEASMRRRRADVGVRARHPLRWVAEVAVLALAAVSLYLLLTGGLGGGAGTDLLVAAAPLLLAGACCVIVLRLYPLPLRLLSRIFRRRRSTVGFLGSVRALRDPVVGVVPVLAVLAGVSVAVFSSVTLSTVAHGTDQAAVRSLGAPMRATAASFVGISDAQYAQIRALPGVRAAARTGLVGSLPTQVPGRAARPTVDVYLADTAGLAQVQRDVPGAAPLPGGLTAGPPAQVVLSPDLAAAGDAVRISAVQARVVGTATALTGLGRSTTFALLDSSVTGFGAFRPVTVLIAPDPGADIASLTAELQKILGPGTVVRTAAKDAAALRAGAMAAGMRTALVASLAAAALAAVVALLLTMIMSVGSRARLLAILRVLGLSLRQRRSVVVWEQAPAAVVALLVGVGLGVGLAALVRATVDLAPFTGGSAQPLLHVDAGLLAALLGGFVVLVAAATWVGLVATRRVTAAVAVKLDEE